MRSLPRTCPLRYSLQTLDRANTDFFSGPPLAALTTLSFSKSIDLQRRAAIVFAEITEKEDRSVNYGTLNPIFKLLDSHDTGVQEAACSALKHLAVNGGYFSVPV